MKIKLLIGLNSRRSFSKIAVLFSKLYQIQICHVNEIVNIVKYFPENQYCRKFQKEFHRREARQFCIEPFPFRGSVILCVQ